MTQVRKRHILTGMKYDRVDLVGDGANGHAHILIAKNKQSQNNVAKRAMGTYQCGGCGASQKEITKSKTCGSCGSDDMNRVVVLVTKKVTPVKKTPKNDDATNAGQYTFEDEQYDQDNGENGQALGDAVERSVLNKKNTGWFDIDVEKSGLAYQSPKGDGSDVDTVDNQRFEHQKEGADPDDDIEEMAMTLPTGPKPDRSGGFKNTNTTSSDSTMATQKSRFYLGKKKRVTQEKPGLNSFDYGDEGSQEVAESAEQMYRSQSQPTRAAQTRLDSTRSKVVVKARQGRKKTNREGLDVLENGNEGIYSHPGVKRNGTNTGHNKHTTRGRTQVAPPGNPMDGKGVSKSMDSALPTVEALNLGVQFAENMHLIMKSGKTDLFPTVMEDFVEAVNAAASAWFTGSSVTKSKDTDKQVEDIAGRAFDILAKASGMSDGADDSDGDDQDDSDSDSSDGSMKNKLKKFRVVKEREQTDMGKKNISKSLNDDDPYAGLSEPVAKKLQQLDELLELQQQEKFDKLAKSLRGIPGYNQDKISKQLRAAFENDEEGGQYLYQTLQASANQAQDSVLFKQIGMPGQGPDGSDPMEKARAFAKSKISKSGDGPTEDQLMVEYMRDNPADFYQEAKQIR